MERGGGGPDWTAKAMIEEKNSLIERMNKELEELKI